MTLPNHLYQVGRGIFMPERRYLAQTLIILLYTWRVHWRWKLDIGQHWWHRRLRPIIQRYGLFLLDKCSAYRASTTNYQRHTETNIFPIWRDVKEQHMIKKLLRWIRRNPDIIAIKCQKCRQSIAVKDVRKHPCFQDRWNETISSSVAHLLLLFFAWHDCRCSAYQPALDMGYMPHSRNGFYRPDGMLHSASQEEVVSQGEKHELDKKGHHYDVDWLLSYCALYLVLCPSSICSLGSDQRLTNTA